MADDSPVEQQTQEIENANDTDEPKEPILEQTEEIPPEKVVAQFCVLSMLVHYAKLFIYLANFRKL
jgi:hypothetical protein